MLRREFGFMKAVVMAGGEGSRLRPLTCGRPKPMAPVLNRPMMEHVVDLLKEHGFSEIGVTLQYRPEDIREYFGSGADYGVHFRYFVEETPLGTAGSVKNAAAFLDETFLVISGDALTDLDLTQAVEFHRRQGAMATLALTRVDCPLEYGVVVTGEGGRIIRFLEKPGWGEVFSDTVNTGIYILEPEVLNYIEPGRMFDFSKDLFPLLLKNNKPLFGLVLPGYWCDVGSLRQYLEAHYDGLSGKVKIKIPGREVSPGVWVEEGASIDPGASIDGPALIGGNCLVGGGVRIEPFTVLGQGCMVQERASIKRSIVWNHVYVGSGAELRGAVVCSRVRIQPGAGIYEGAVVGDDSVIGGGSVIKPDVKLWPYKRVEDGVTVQRNVIWGTCLPRKIFGFEGVTGTANAEITPEFGSRLGAAFGSVCGAGSRVLVSSDSYPASRMIKSALACGLQSAGAGVWDAGAGTTAMHRFAVRSLGCRGGVHVRVSLLNPDRVTLVFSNSRGGNISRGEERKVEGALFREDFLRAEASRVLPPCYVPGVSESYLRGITRSLDVGAIRRAGFKLVLAYDEANLGRFISWLCDELGIKVVNACGQEPEGEIWSRQAGREKAAALARMVEIGGADAGAVLDSGADRLILVDERGGLVQEDLLTALIALLILKGRDGPVVVPVTAPRIIEKMAGRYNGRVIRTKTALPDFLDKVLSREVDNVAQFFLHFDALAALGRVLEFMARQGAALSELVAEIPGFFVHRREVAVPWETKGRVIRQLIQDPPAGELELLDGVKVYHPDGWALILPDPDEPVCRVFSEASSMEIAESLTDFYVKKVGEIAGLKK
jgi:mannose-1-phosphate guanylyltransferase/phosphomannomutase